MSLVSNEELEGFRDLTNLEPLTAKKVATMAAELLSLRAQAEEARKSAVEAERLAVRAGELVRSLDVVFELVKEEVETVIGCSCALCSSVRAHSKVLGEIERERTGRGIRIPTGRA